MTAFDNAAHCGLVSVLAALHRGAHSASRSSTIPRAANSNPRLERVAAINGPDLGRRCHEKAAFGDAAQQTFYLSPDHHMESPFGRGATIFCMFLWI